MFSINVELVSLLYIVCATNYNGDDLNISNSSIRIVMMVAFSNCSDI